MSAAELGLDRSGNNNTWTVTNMTLAIDQMLDSPTNNFCTWNPLAENHRMTVTEGNLKCFNGLPPNTTLTLFGTHVITSGKWYFEARGSGSPDGDNFGFCTTQTGSSGEGTEEMSFYFRNNANIEGVGAELVYGSGGTVEAFAIDMDAGKCWWAKENVWHGSGDPAAGTNEFDTFTSTEMVPAMNIARNNHYLWANFGADSSFAGEETAQGNQDGNGYGDFYYTPPTGFLALCSANLPAVDVVPSEHFNTILYTGDGGGTQAQTGVGFEPDMIWVKSRSLGNWHGIADQVRGAQKFIYPNSDEYGDTSHLTDYINSFDSDGFTHGDNGTVGASGTYVAWNWFAGNTALGTGDFTQGTIASICRRNVDAGFSIVKYTGVDILTTTVGHGLSKAPEMIKNLSGGGDWIVLVSHGGATDATDYLSGLNTTAAIYDGATTWNDTEPTATVFSVGTNDDVNDSGDDYIAYCWHSVDGYSKVGSYNGTGAVDGPFVYTGFRPAVIIIKNVTTASTYWHILDSKRPGYNVVGNMLFPNSSDDEDVYTATTDPLFDITSNGFKLRGQYSHINGSGNTHIFIAFAETPFKYSNAR